MENTERNIRLFLQLLSCVHDISFFTLDSHLNIIYSNHADDRIPATVFMLDESHPAVLNTIRETRMASVITDALDFFWIADPAFDDLGELLYIHVLLDVVRGKGPHPIHPVDPFHTMHGLGYAGCFLEKWSV